VGKICIDFERLRDILVHGLHGAHDIILRAEEIAVGIAVIGGAITFIIPTLNVLIGFIASLIVLAVTIAIKKLNDDSNASAHSINYAAFFLRRLIMGKRRSCAASNSRSVISQSIQASVIDTPRFSSSIFLPSG